MSSKPIPPGRIKPEKKVTVDLDVLDHNNFSKTLVKKVTTPTKLVKTTNMPPVRHYPGKLKIVSKGPPKGAVYAEDLEKEEAEMNKSFLSTKELTSEDLMRDPDYLKIDQSKLPLEMFDSLEFDMLDKKPKQWLDLKCNAKTPFYHDGNWVWRPVTVNGYNESTNQFDVRFIPDGIQKFVHRLNLRFDLEDEGLFNERRRVAELGLKEAKQIMRLDHFIMNQPNELIRAIRKESIKHIHERVVDGLPSSVPFPEQHSHLGNLLRSLTADTIRWYARTMKKTVLFARLSNKAYRSEETINRYTQLRLPMLPPPPQVPYSGKLPCPDYPFEDRCQRIENLHYSAQRETLSVYRWLHDKWIQKFQYYEFFETDLSCLELPCTVEEFSKIQAEKAEKTLGLLQKDFRRAFMDQLLDYVQDVFDFFQSNLTVFKNGALYKLFRVLDLKLSNFLRTMLLKSLGEWFQLISEYTYVLPLLETDELPESSFNYPLRIRETEFSFQLYHKSPLFKVELIISNENVVPEPSVEDIQNCFLQFIDKMIDSVSSIISVDKDTMSLLTLDPRVLLNIGTGDHLYADVDLILNRTKSSIVSRVAKIMEQPLKLCALFDEYMWLLEREVDEYLENFILISTRDEMTLTQEVYKAELDKLENARRNILELSFDTENFSLVQISTKEIKRILSTRARELRDGLLKIIAAEARQQNINIIERYNAILDRIAEKPANEKQLAELREFIESSKTTVNELKNMVVQTRKMLSLLEIFNVPLSVEDMGVSWSTLEYPSKVESSGREVEALLDADKVRMMDRLIKEKESFEIRIEKLGMELKEVKLLDNYENKEKIVERVNELMDNLEKAKEMGENFNMRERVFNFSPTEYGMLDKFIEELNPFYKLWTMVSDFHNSKNDWLNGDFKDLDGNKIEIDVSDWWKGSYKLAKAFEEEFPGAASCGFKLREETTEFKKHLPVIQSLASKALKADHWAELSELLNKPIDPQEDLTLQTLLDLDAGAHIEKIQEITTAAEKQYKLEVNLNAMKKEWQTIEFEVKPYKNTGTFVVGGIDDIIALLDDHIVKTQTMRGSPYLKGRPIEGECKDWERRLKYAQSMLDALIGCQRTWMYLEPIFLSEDITRQLPTESKRFSTVDHLWKKTMASCNQDPNFMTQADPDKKLEESFKQANEKLEQISKGLNDYLETKRVYFPRFYFLSPDELLEILSQTKEPRAVQPHLAKCFEGINKVKFESDLKISNMISAEGEVVQMDKLVNPESPGNKGNVEKWLLELESIQWVSLRSLTVLSLDEYNTMPRKQWILNWPAQVIICVSSIYWTSEVTAALQSSNSSALIDYSSKLSHQLKDMVDLVRSGLNKLGRLTLGALTTIDVHNRDVVGKMVELGTREPTDFQWVSQLRYYWEDSWKDGQAVKKGMKSVVARIVNARCLYGYEYLGNSMRLVITPLTDRCYRTMIGAVDLLYGGAPEGPAGTGKTETVKDLSKAVAIHCVVFNCSDGMDYLQMAKFFKGLAGCGSWCCFDEFNRINIEVLSVIAEQILKINQAKREQKEIFNFEGTQLRLNPNCNTFITMNPGYAGRAELPDNLKALFRPCAMMVPDYAMIGEIRLYSFGFENAKENAQKIVKVLQLSSEQLSSQKHYDYGMRAVNSILVAAGNLRQQLGNDPEWDEAKIVLRSINDVNLAKFLVEDLPLFHGITSDLFPNVKLPNSNYGALIDCIQITCNEGIEIAPGNIAYLENKPSFQSKTIQLYEMVLVRHGVMVVGQTCSGKTSSIHNLAKAMTKANLDGHHQQFAKVHIYTINPKSLTSGQLYGLFDENTHEFIDGILAVTFRKCAKDTSPDRKWMMFDGPVDAVWIENMNTVLDDNKKLCLNSGEIIKMSDPMTMFFEAEDLEQASPATVSRVGMIFCETRNVGWTAIRNIWLRFLQENVKPYSDVLSQLFDWIFPPMSYFVVKHCTSPTLSVPQELILAQTRLLKCMLDFDDGLASDMVKVIEGCFVFSLIWSVGSCVDGEGRKKFDRLLRMLLSGEIYMSPEYLDFSIKNPDYISDESRRISHTFPEGGLVYDYIFDTKTAKWINWLEGQPFYRIEKDATFNSIVVPTIDTIRNEWLIEKLLRKGHHVLCTGETGTGKSVSIKNKLLKGMPSNFNQISINFSAQTSANQTQDLIDSKLEKQRKGVYGPPMGCVTVVFVDDLNMPAKEIFGAQPPIEILRQWMDHQGWYDRKENEFKRLVGIQFCAAMGPPGGGRTQITKRYVRHFNIINFVNFSDESLSRVFGTILDWKLSQGFSSSIKQISASTVTATLEIFNTISSKLLPTPAKSHYTFNLRDLSKVFQGILQGEANFVKEKDGFIRLWSHECLRVFHDRLIDDQDRSWFKDLISQVSKTHFNVEYSRIQGNNSSLIFCNFADPRTVTKPYVEWVERENLPKIMADYLEDYNQMTNKPMKLVLFESAIEHIARVSRIINQPYGNALLVGVGGSGRKSLTRLAVSIADFELFTIEITKSYGTSNWREDIKTMMNKAGVANRPTVFMIDDTQIVKETFLEDINGILNTGEVANLFNSDEMSMVMDALQKPCQEAGVNPGSPAEVYNFFVGRVRTNLHVVICLSPIGEAFRNRLRMFPSLVNCCTIDWFTEWPEEALKSVAQTFLQTLDMESHVREGVIDVCVNMQLRVVEMAKLYLAQMGRHYYVTPTSYLELINTFTTLLRTQRKEVLDAKARYDNGLAKLKDTAEQVNSMQIYLEDLQPKLKEATIATDELVVKLSRDQIVANEQNALVEAEAEKCAIQAREAKTLKDSCEADLAEAMPTLEAAVRALKELDKKDIIEMKTMKKPSYAIKMTMAAICIMLGYPPDKKVKDGDPKVDPYWGVAVKEVLGDPQILKKLENYERDNMDPVIVTKAKVFTEDEFFDPDNIAKKGSSAASGLAKWVHAMVKYDRVAKIVAPKRAAAKEAELSYKLAQDTLASKRAALKEITDQLAELKASFEEAEEKKEKLKSEALNCEAKLRRADALIKGLGGEKTRWTEMSRSFGLKYDNITGDIVLSAGAIAYLGAFLSSYRDQAIHEWSALLRSKDITCSDDFTLRETLGNPVVIRSWVISKLPNDSFSIENGIMVFKSNRFPLMIDPEGQANKWVKKMEEPHQLKVVKQTQLNFVRILSNSLTFGNPVLIENVPDSLDPMLEPILLKQWIKSGSGYNIRLGDATIEYDPKFRLYITTKLRNPHYPPELCVKVNLLNFMATADGLQDQMLGRVVALEKSELEKERIALLLEDAENQKQLKEIEDKILFLLKNAETNILDDEVLIDTLAKSKVTSNIINDKVKISETTQARIAKVRQGYVPVAYQASQLFFCISDLSVVDPMYQYSLDWYINLFEMSIDQAEKSKILEDRLHHLNDCFSYLLYQNVCRSLFEKDKLLFSFLLTTKILVSLKSIDPIDLKFFLQGSTSMSLSQPNPYKSWLSDKSWGDLLALEQLPSFQGFTTNFKIQHSRWQEITISNSPIDLIYSALGEEMDPFRKLCVLRCVRPDAVIPAIQGYIATEMGTRFIEPPPFDLNACFSDSRNFTPLIFVLTPGAAPMSELRKLATERGYGGNKLDQISLGQGQGPKAERAIDEAGNKGTWVCLENCHLCISWLPTLEKICEDLATDENLHKDFRLWLTSEPSPAFPAFVLQNGVKMTIEPPKGMRANLLGSLALIEDSHFESCQRHAEFKKMLFGLVFFHAVVRERRKFGPLGWNIQYVFSGYDLNISMDQLRIFLDDLRPQDSIPFAALSYLVGECNYGGRVTDDKDRRCILNILDDFYHPLILRNDYKFSPSGTYYAPPDSGNLESFRDYVRSLPFYEGPEIFGLHDNANITCALSETNALLDTALGLQPRSMGGGQKSWGEILEEIAIDISAKIPKLYDIEKALILFPVKYEESMNTVLTQELIRFNRLILEVTVTLQGILKAIKGLVVMSGELEQMGNSLVVGKVPALWAAVAYPSLKPLGPWVLDLLARIQFLGDWMSQGTSPSIFWVSGFFFTQAFITGTLQNFARKHHVPIDLADFDFRVLTPTDIELAPYSRPDDGAYINGLFLEGARWEAEKHVLAESHSRELFVPMPLIHLNPKKKSQIPLVEGVPEQYTGHVNGSAHVYLCPVYKTSFRQGVLLTTGHSTNFVMFIRIPMSHQHKQKHWIKRGVALLTQLDT